VLDISTFGVVAPLISNWEPDGTSIFAWSSSEVPTVEKTDGTSRWISARS
jgi:hypothetical protein